jgi:ribonuclease Z
MAERAGIKYLTLTHLAPPVGATMQGTVRIQGGPLTEQDYKKAAQDGGYTGTIVVGTDLASVRLPPK